jgi:hypothetical protein
VDAGPAALPIVSEDQARRWRALKTAAGLTFLVVPVDVALLDWVSRATTDKAECYTPLPRYQAAIATLVPALFVVASLFASIAGIVRIVHGRRHAMHAERAAGVVCVVLAVPALFLALGLGIAVWFSVGFATWCF